MENRYGTTASMIVQEIESKDGQCLVAIDNRGLYLTSQDKVDRALADVNRYGVSRETFNEQLRELGIDPFQLFEANKHLLETSEAGDHQKKKYLNPIKASKRGM